MTQRALDGVPEVEQQGQWRQGATAVQTTVGLPMSNWHSAATSVTGSTKAFSQNAAQPQRKKPRLAVDLSTTRYWMQTPHPRPAQL